MKRFNVNIQLSSVDAEETVKALQACIASISRKGLFNSSVAIDQTRVGYMEVTE